MNRMHRIVRRMGRGFAFGFSAAVGAWIALVLLAVVVTLILRPWG
jgi:hypothetical protein